MPQSPTRNVYKYFEPEDRFVRVRVADSDKRFRIDDLCAPEGSPGSAEEYQRAIVERFVEADDRERLEAESDADRTRELFQLVVDVNPQLDLTAVVIEESAEVAAPLPAKRKPDDRGRAFRRRLRRLAHDVDHRLGERIIGQPDAVGSIGRAVRRAALGWQPGGPLASLLLIGPTGTGKTELAKSLAQELGGEDLLIRVDCTEFGEGHEYAKLIGAPPGYVGHAEGGVLARGLERAPRAVVLFDEIEKAHDQLHHILLQVLDEGRITDGLGTRLDFRQSFILLTSNSGTRELGEASDPLGFGDTGLTEASRTDIVRSALGERFRPEFLARLDEIVLFRDLSPRDAVRIAERRLCDLAARVRRGGPRVKFSSSVARWVAKRGLAIGEGARGIATEIRREIEAPLAELAITTDGRPWIRVQIRNRRPRFTLASEDDE